MIGFNEFGYETDEENDIVDERPDFEGDADAIEFDECPSCGAIMLGCVCEECGWPDTNQGWLGENYG